MKKYYSAFVVGAVVLSALSFIFVLDKLTDILPAWPSYILALLISGIVTFGFIRRMWAFLKRRHYTNIRNNWKSVHIAGMYPKGSPHADLKVRSGSIPLLKRHRDKVSFVAHEDVFEAAAEMRAEIEEANKGIPKEDRHPVKIYTYSFREPITRDAVFEAWDHADVEGLDNSYPMRIIRNVEDVIARESVKQFDADEKAFRKVAMGQKVSSKRVGDQMFEW